MASSDAKRMRVEESKAAGGAHPCPESTALLLCDLQERFATIIHQFDAVVKGSCFMCQVSTELEMQVIVTEQYPKAFKNTVPEIKALLGEGTPVVEKTKFSMAVPEVLERLQRSGTKSVIVCGIEAHVCVLQTCIDLQKLGYDVYVCLDAVSSSTAFERTVAIKRLESMGVVLTTTASVVFQLLQDAKHPKFKAVSKLIKDNGSTPSLLAHL